ncbi:nuclear transport factor 2 family protein [Pseudonocardia yunnanensis]|uniref:Nuclear transport factor 2 family protein n=1 Tax=Pseudonocardia yunnanensis TaxID=58107 RepID=A0ABW4F4M4_9PSEU
MNWWNPASPERACRASRDFWNRWHDAFPRQRVTTQPVVAEGDTIAQASTFQGTHSGSLTTPGGTWVPGPGARRAPRS